MSEPTTEPTPEPEVKTQGDPADKPLGDNGEKALKAERSRAAAAEKQAAALQKQIDDLKRAEETAVERAQRELQEAKDAATKATTDAMRFRIAAETGITDNVDLILTAADEETMRKQADLWKERTSTGPKPDLTQGTGTPAKGSPAEDFAKFIGGQLAR